MSSAVYHIVLFWFCIHLHPSEGLLCFQCSTIPNTPQFREGCDNPTEDLSIDCKTLWNPRFYNADEQNSFLFTPSSNRSTVQDGISLDWLCVNMIALIDEQLFTIRGCIWALTEAMSNRCEAMDNDYTVNNITIAKGELCFCDTDMCNSANTRYFTNPLIITISTLLLLGSSTLMARNV